MKFYNLLTWMGFATMLTSCFSPKSIVVMDADDPDIRWSYGRQIITQKGENLEAAIYFDNYGKEDLIFDVEVTNWGQKSVLVAPENIYMKCANNETPYYATDPERRLLTEKIERNRDEAAAKNLALGVGVAVVATAVAVAVADNDNNGGRSDNNAFDDVGNTVYISTYVAPPVPSAALPPSIDFWENYSLRKTTLDQNFKVGGKVVLPRLDNCPALEVYVPVGDEVFMGRFKQRIVKP